MKNHILNNTEVTYNELILYGKMISSNSSLHLWDEKYEYDGKLYQVMGAVSDPSYIEITEL